MPIVLLQGKSRDNEHGFHLMTTTIVCQVVEIFVCLILSSLHFCCTNSQDIQEQIDFGISATYKVPNSESTDRQRKHCYWFQSLCRIYSVDFKMKLQHCKPYPQSWLSLKIIIYAKFLTVKVTSSAFSPPRLPFLCLEST